MFKKAHRPVLAAIVLLASCEPSTKGLDLLFPGPGFEKGWSWQNKPKHYVPENLYEYINGEAELYLSYHFKELATLTYFWGSPEDTFVTVDIYDMGTPIDGFGLYSTYRYPGYAFEAIGSEAFGSEFGLKFLKGRYVVDLKGSDESEKVQNAVRVLAARIAERITDPAELPELLRRLPEKNQKPKTLRYIAKEMLNQAFLPQGLEAKYDAVGEEVTGFVVLFDSTRAAEEGLDRLRTFFQESNIQPVQSRLPAGAAFAVKTPYHGITLLGLAGDRMYGIQDLTKTENGFDLFNDMMRLRP